VIFLALLSHSNPIFLKARSVAENFKALEADYERLAAAGKATRQKFEDLQCVQQIRNDLDEVSNWVNEKIALCSTKTAVKDLLALSVQQVSILLISDSVFRTKCFRTMELI
jgi:hypothetical protein